MNEIQAIQKLREREYKGSNFCELPMENEEENKCLKAGCDYCFTHLCLQELTKNGLYFIHKIIYPGLLMLPILVFLTLCLVSSLAAENIGNVEYQLPEEAKNWKSENTGPTEKIPGHTILYQPESQSPLGIEFFGAYIKKNVPHIKNSEALKNEIEKTYPGQQIDFKVLQTDSNSELVEWIVRKDDRERLHGWARIFSTPEATTMLFYQNEKGSIQQNVDGTWLKTLKEAKLTTETPPAKN